MIEFIFNQIPYFNSLKIQIQNYIINHFIMENFVYFYVVIVFTTLFITMVFIFFLFFYSYTNRTLTFNKQKIFEFFIYISYFLFFYTVVTIVFLLESETKKFSIFFFNEQFSFFFFVLDEFSFFFIFMLNFVLFCTFLSFHTNKLEEYSIQNEENMFSKKNHISYLFFSFMIFSLQLILFIFFTNQNIFVFFISFESSVLPIFFIIGFFGKRSYKFKAMSYLLYFTVFSAIPFFFVLLLIYIKTGVCFYPHVKFLLNNTSIFSKAETIFYFFFFFIPFGVKFSFFPFHTWLPEAHVEASTEGSMLLSGIMLKLGFFGIVKYCFGFFPQVMFAVAPIIVSCSLIGAFITALTTYRQLDVKKIIAYSSIVHMNIAVLGYFSMSSLAVHASLFMNFSHAVTSVGLFYAIGILQDKIKTRNLLEVCGLWDVMPFWSFCFFILLLSNAGMPGTIGFVGEAGLIWGMYSHFPFIATLTLAPAGIMGFRNFLLFTQLCQGIPHPYLRSNFFKKDTDSKSIEIFKSWDINQYMEGKVLYFLTISCVIFGVKPSNLLYLLEKTSAFFQLLYIPIILFINLTFYET